MANEPMVSGEVVVATGLYTCGSTPSKDLIFAYPYRITDGTPVNNSTVLVADDVLLFAIGANEVWQFECGIFWTSPSSGTGLKFDFTGPAAPTSVKICGNPYDAQNEDSLATAFSTAMSAKDLRNSGNNINPPSLLLIIGTVINAANAGTVTLRIAQDSAAVEDTKLLKGSYIIPRRLA